MSKLPTEGGIRSRAGVRAKLRFAFTETQLEEGVANIRQLTQDFRTLVKQTAPPHAREAVSKPTWSTRNRVTKFAVVKTAADNLYEALGQACTMHTAHQAHLSLQPTYGESSHIRFTIAFRQMTPQSAGSEASIDVSNFPMWLTVESIITGTITADTNETSTDNNNIAAEVRSSLKRVLDSSSVDETAPRKPKKLTKSVKFQPNITSPLVRPSPSTHRSPAESNIQNLCAHSNFCNQLRKLFGEPLRSPHSCVGYLEFSGDSKHLVYIDSKARTCERLSSQSFTAATPQNVPSDQKRKYFVDDYSASRTDHAGQAACVCSAPISCHTMAYKHNLQ